MSGQAADTAPDTGATVNSWVNVVRRAHLDETMKPIALLLASYANKDGTSIHPGVARLAVQSGKSYRTVQRVLARLRAIGLIEAMPRVKTPRGWKDGYRLILAADLLDKLDVPTPAAEDAAIEAIASRERERVRKYRREHRPGGPAKRHLDGITGSTAKRHLDGVTDATTIRHSDGVTSSDDTPKLRATCNATGNSLTSDAAPPPTIDPPYQFNPPLIEARVRYRGTGSTGAPASNDDDPDISVSDDQAAEAERGRQLAALEQLMARSHDDGLTE